MFETALPVPRLNDNITGARPGCDGCQAAKIAEDRSRGGSTHLLLGRQRNQLGKTAIPGVPAFIFPPWVVAAFLFCPPSHPGGVRLAYAKKIFKLGMGAAALLYRGFAKRHSRISICRILHVYGRWERKGGNAYERLVFAVVFEGAVGAFCGFRLNQEKMDLFLHGSICGVLCGACACWILPALDCRERIDVLDSRFCLRHFRHRRGRILYACARRQISIFLCRHTQRLLQDCRAIWAGGNARNRGLFWKVFRFAFGRLGSGVPHVRCSVFHCSGLFLKSSPAPSNRRAARGFFGGGNRAQYALGVRGVLF